MDLQNRPRKHASADGWSIATALGLLAVAFVWDRMAPAQPKESGGLEPEETRAGTHPPPACVTEGGDRGRHATSPSEIPARGWKDILLRVYGNIGDHRILALAAGMTYYSILAIFPALAALVAIYGFFSDPGSIAKHLDRARRIRARRRHRRGARAAHARRLQRRSRRSASPSRLDCGFALERERRDEIPLRYPEHRLRRAGEARLPQAERHFAAFTLAAIGFVLAALAAVVAVPSSFNYLGLSNAVDLLLRIGRWPAMFFAVALALA